MSTTIVFTASKLDGNAYIIITMRYNRCHKKIGSNQMKVDIMFSVFPCISVAILQYCIAENIITVF